MHVKFEPIQRSWLISQKDADSAGPRYIMKFQHFFKVHQISSNLQNIFESSSETCMWNLSPFREVDLIHRKMHTVPAFEIWNFNIFPKFTKFFIKLAEHIGIIIRNMHVKFEPFQRSYIFSQKNADSARARNIMKFQHFFKVHQLSSYLQNLFESSSETCMWNLSLFREVIFFTEKCWQCQP